MDNQGKYTQYNPFPGIRSFDVQEHALFFGREAQIEELAHMLQEHRMIIVTGASGSGKSSLVKAGLVPAVLNKQLEPEGNPWSILKLRPGNDPIRNLAKQLQSFLSLQAYKSLENWTLSSLEEALYKDRSALAGLYRKLMATHQQQHLIVIDQFEEVFRYYLTNDAEHQRKSNFFIDLLIDLVRDAAHTNAHVVITMQSDYLDDCASFPELILAINKASYLIPHMSNQQIQDAIRMPVEACGAALSPALINRIMEDMAEKQGELLPVLQHAMLRTWDYWKAQGDTEIAIDVSHYEAIGGLKQVISKHANEIYDSLPQHEDKVIAERVFKSLVEASADGRLSRRPTKLREISVIANAKEEQVVEVIEAFRHPSCGFLMPGVNVVLTPETTIDIAHESIIQTWGKLAGWVKEEVASAQLYLRLSNTARLYQEGRSGLWVNPELELGLRWLEQQQPNITWALRYDNGFERAMEFLQFSKREYELKVAEREQQQQQALVRARRSVFVLGTASVISLIFLIISLNLRFQAEQAEKVAREKETEAVWQRNQAEGQRKEAVLQTKISEQQQLIAEQQRIIAEEQKVFAIAQQDIAQQQQRLAEEQRHLAEEKKREAEAERQKAIVASEEADRQRVLAEGQRLIAEEKRKEADEERKKSVRLRMLALSRAVAIQAVKISAADLTELPHKLALFAWSLNQEHNGHDKDADIFNALSEIGDEKPAFRGHKDAVRAVVYHPKDEKVFLSAGDDGHLYQWNTELPKEKVNFSAGKHGKTGFRALSYNTTGTQVAAGTYTGDILVWSDPHNPPMALLDGHEVAVEQVIFLPNQHLLSIDAEGNALLWDLRGEALIPSPLLPDGMTKLVACELLPGDQDHLLGVTQHGKLIKIRLGVSSKPEILYEVEKGVVIHCMAVNQNGTTIALGGRDGRIFLADLNQIDQGQWLVGHVSAVTDLDFNAHTKTLASSSFDATIRIWDLNNTKVRPITIAANDDWVYHLDHSPSGQQLISGGQDRTIHLIQVDAKALASKVCSTLSNHEISDEDWDKFIGADIPKVPVCQP